jgi:hypothetical protein
MNPTFKQSTVNREIKKDSAKASAEYLAIWRDDIASYISREVVEACIERGVRERPFQAGIKYRAFCDPGGGSSDAFTLSVAHQEGEAVVIDCLREVTAPFSPPDAVAELAKVLKPYRLTTVTGDKYAAEWPVAQFREHGITYRHSEMNRSEIYLEFLPLLNARNVRLLDYAESVDQICNLERRTARSGRDSIDHSPGAHDDLANSVAGAATLMMTGRNEIVAIDQADFMARLNLDNYQRQSDGTMRFQPAVRVESYPP